MWPALLSLACVPTNGSILRGRNFSLVARKPTETSEVRQILGIFAEFFSTQYPDGHFKVSFASQYNFLGVRGRCQFISIRYDFETTRDPYTPFFKLPPPLYARRCEIFRKIKFFTRENVRPRENLNTMLGRECSEKTIPIQSHSTYLPVVSPVLHLWSRASHTQRC